jgi:membrane protease YdiL (CAAX protease family)
MFYVKQIPLGISFFVYFIIEFILSFGNAAVIEEPIFRGFLMGALYERGVNDIWIIIIQAVVFDICHLEAFSKPYTFFCVIPIVGLVLGWLTIKTKTITNSLVAHSTFDTIVAMLMYNLQKFV